MKDKSSGLQGFLALATMAFMFTAFYRDRVRKIRWGREKSMDNRRGNSASSSFFRTFLVATSGALLASCAAVPRGPAGTLADAGIATTSAFATDARDTAAGIRDIDVMDSFTATYAICLNANLECKSQLKSGPNYEARKNLTKAIELRAAAIEGLGKAYKALKTEAEYDARADLVGATNSAIDGVNNFATVVTAIGGAAPAAALISAPLQKIVGFGAGLLADQAQRKRLLRGSHAISAATQRFRDALAVEAFVFDSLAGYIEKNRTAAKLTLLDAGLVSNQEILQTFSASVGMKAMPAVDAIVSKSPATKGAVRAIIESQSRAEVDRVRAKYQAALGALDALVISHQNLEAEHPVSLADVNRFLGELDVALKPATEGN
jgi:hypothetical protein